MMFNFLYILTISLLFLPLAIFGLYGIVLFYFSKKNKISRFNRILGYQPKVSVLVPTHNEENMIGKKIENLLVLDYPQEKIELVFVDDSTDSTPSIIEDYAKKSTSVHLIHFNERKGYSPSMIAGCESANGEILVFNDAGSLLDASAISNIVRNFEDPKIGGVTGRPVILNKNENIGQSEDWYLMLSDFMRTGETNMDSTFHFNGEACAVRKELIIGLRSCPATFDTASALFIREKGFRTIYDPSIKFYEYAPNTHSDRIKQKEIRATNMIQILLEFKGMIFRSQYGWFGSFILPMNLIMLTFVPILVFAGMVALIVLTIVDLSLSIVLWSIIGISILFSFLFSKHAVSTFIEFEYILVKAIYNVIVKKETYDKMDRAESTRRI
jgi:cellulose synthase/poly-beta-1,6-N-acetylglucosamine synthase-like glycosyltransferase